VGLPHELYLNENLFLKKKLANKISGNTAYTAFLKVMGTLLTNLGPVLDRKFQ